MACSVQSRDDVAQAGSRHTIIQRIPGPDGDYDYLSVDSATHTLYIARGYGVMTVALLNGHVRPALIRIPAVSAVLPVSGNEMLSTAYDGNEAIIFDRRSGRKLARIRTGTNPDAAVLDPFGGNVYVMNARSNNATEVDLRARRAVATIAIGGKPESGIADGVGHLFVNVEDDAMIAKIDIDQRAVTARFPLRGCIEPTGIALDFATGTLLSACHNRIAKLIDMRTGADRGSIAIGAGADGAIFDPATRTAYIPCKDGTLAIFRLDRAGQPYARETVVTAPGARTAALDPATHRLYLAAARPIRGTDGKEALAPGTFEILVVAPGQAH